MVTSRKKLRTRKQLFLKISVLTGLFVATIVIAYFVSLKLFGKSTYISPLAKVLPQDTSYKNDQNIELIKKSLSGQKVEVTSVKQEGSSYVILLKDNSQIILSSDKEINSQISSLQFILSRLTMEGKLFSQLDLRFDKPVVKLRK